MGLPFIRHTYVAFVTFVLAVYVVEVAEQTVVFPVTLAVGVTGAVTVIVIVLLVAVEEL